MDGRNPRPLLMAFRMGRREKTEVESLTPSVQRFEEVPAGRNVSSARVRVGVGQTWGLRAGGEGVALVDRECWVRRVLCYTTGKKKRKGGEVEMLATKTVDRNGT